jgi:beta-lactamase superfamily II metal-dependent hydrolase
MSAWNAQPDSDEVEITFFGPGYGESSVIHVGNGQWLIIDSCITDHPRLPAPIHYLQSLGVDLRLQISKIIATHWHDDHVRGLSEVLRSCPDASFVCSAALRTDEFFNLVSAYSGTDFKNTSGVDEFSAIFGDFAQQGRVAQAALEGRNLVKPLDRVHSSCTIQVLYPSDKAWWHSVADFGRLLPTPYTPKTRLLSNPNNTSVVVWISVLGAEILLGADLEVTTMPGTGWAYICSQHNPSKMASVFKVPHHGSVSSYYPVVWSQMLAPGVYACVTPYQRGRNFLPTSTDIDTLKSHTANAFITSRMQQRRIKRPPNIQKLITASAKNQHCIFRGKGHVTFRIKGSSHRVKLEGAAEKL